LLLANTYTTILLATGFYPVQDLLATGRVSLTSKQATVGQGVAMGLSNSFMSLGCIAATLGRLCFDMNFDYPYPQWRGDPVHRILDQPDVADTEPQAGRQSEPHPTVS
jgi:hypothetical protein